MFSRKIFSKVAVAAILASIVAAPQSASAAWQTLPCKSYSYACAQFGYAGIDRYGFYNYGSNIGGNRHNCTAYAAFILENIAEYDARISYLGNAYTWAIRAAADGYRVSKTPHDHDIAEIDIKDSTDPYDKGHVAWVETVVYKVDGSVNYIITSDDNVSGFTSAKKRYPGTTAWPDNFITFNLINFTGGNGAGIGPRPTLGTLG